MVRPIRVEIREETEGEHLTLSVAGELDLSGVPVLAQHVDGQIESDHRALTLDLSGVTFMDSSGLRLLIELNERAQRDAWSLSLIPPKHESAKLVLRMTGADSALPFADHSDGAPPSEGDSQS
jgi:anti-sigma B factor antagonist